MSLFNPKSKIQNPKFAFTLIELLVVIAIIAVLVAILLPALGKARAQTKLTVCLAGMNQMGTGMLMYLKEYNDFFPNYWYGNSTTPWYDPDCRWFQRLYNRKYVNDKKVFYCPTNPDRADSVLDDTPQGVGKFKRGYVDYGLNLWLNYDYGKGSPARETNLSAVSDPAKTIMNMESRCKIGDGETFIVVPIDSTGLWGEGVAWPLHDNKTANALWIDGHVTSIQAPVPYDSPKSGQNEYYLPSCLGSAYTGTSLWDPYK